jgi:hypothetical protein
LSDFLFDQELHDAEDWTWLSQSFSPDLPTLEDRVVNLSLENPFESVAEKRHPSLRKLMSLPKDGAVNGYIKFRLWRHGLEDDEPSKKLGLSGRQRLPVQDEQAEKPKPRLSIIPALNVEHVPPLPPDFGRGMTLDSMDRKLLDFC